SAEELDFDLTSERHLAEKEEIASAALELIEPGMSVGISAGSTTWTFARRLAGVDDLTIVTNSLRVAEEFRRIDPARIVVLTGGVRTPSDALVGPVAEQALRTLHCDVVFLGVHGVDVTAGLTTPNLAEAETNRALVASGGDVVVLADHTKFGRVGLTTIVPLSAVDTLITDTHADPGAVAAAREHIEDVRLAGDGAGGVGIARRFGAGPRGGRRRGRAVVFKHDSATFVFSARHPALAVVFNDGAPRLPRHVRHRRVRPPRRLRRD